MAYHAEGLSWPFLCSWPLYHGYLSSGKSTIHKLEEAEGEDWLGISENQVRGAAFYLSQGTTSLREGTDGGEEVKSRVRHGGTQTKTKTLATVKQKED